MIGQLCRQLVQGSSLEGICRQAAYDILKLPQPTLGHLMPVILPEEDAITAHVPAPWLCDTRSSAQSLALRSGRTVVQAPSAHSSPGRQTPISIGGHPG